MDNWMVMNVNVMKNMPSGTPYWTWHWTPSKEVRLQWWPHYFTHQPLSFSDLITHPGSGQCEMTSLCLLPRSCIPTCCPLTPDMLCGRCVCETHMFRDKTSCKISTLSRLFLDNTKTSFTYSPGISQVLLLVFFISFHVWKLNAHGRFIYYCNMLAMHASCTSVAVRTGAFWKVADACEADMSWQEEHSDNVSG